MSKVLFLYDLKSIRSGSQCGFLYPKTLDNTLYKTESSIEPRWSLHCCPRKTDEWDCFTRRRTRTRRNSFCKSSFLCMHSFSSSSSLSPNSLEGCAYNKRPGSNACILNGKSHVDSEGLCVDLCQESRLARITTSRINNQCQNRAIV